MKLITKSVTTPKTTHEYTCLCSVEQQYATTTRGFSYFNSTNY